jgi:hypothetical protein
MVKRSTARWLAVALMTLALPAPSWAQRGGGMRGGPGGGMRGGSRPGVGGGSRPGVRGGIGARGPGFGVRNNFSGRVRGGVNAGFRDGFQVDPALVGSRRFHGDRFFHNGGNWWWGGNWCPIWPSFGFTSFIGFPYGGFYLGGWPYLAGYPFYDGFGLGYVFGDFRGIYNPQLLLASGTVPVTGRTPAPGATAEERGFYLEQQRRDRDVPGREPPTMGAAAEPASLPDLLRRQLRVELAEAGVYLVRWVGPVGGLRTLEVRSVNEKDETLASRLLQDAPYRGLLRVPEGAAAVIVTLQAMDGASINLRLPVAEFKALGREGN